MVFDLDGTVWDSAEGIIASVRHTFDHFDLEGPDTATVVASLGPPLQRMLEELGVPARHIDEATEVYRDRYVTLGVYEAALYPGMVEVLDALAADGHRLATATSKGEVPTLQMLEHFELRDRFEVVGAATWDRTRTSKAAVLAHSLRELGSPAAAECVLVGDRRHDAEGAAQHGIDCIGVLWGYGDQAELRAAGLTELVAQPSDLLDALRRRAGRTDGDEQ